MLSSKATRCVRMMVVKWDSMDVYNHLPSTTEAIHKLVPTLSRNRSVESTTYVLLRGILERDTNMVFESGVTPTRSPMDMLGTPYKSLPMGFGTCPY